jgi:hypothetical protein
MFSCEKKLLAFVSLSRSQVIGSDSAKLCILALTYPRIGGGRHMVKYRQGYPGKPCRGGGR